METTKIERFRMEGLRNAEFTMIVPHILAIMSRSSFNQQLSKRVDAIRAFLPDLDKIEAQDRRWRDNRLLNEAEQLRDGYVNTLIRTEKTFRRIVMPGNEEASEKLTALFDKHGRNIATDRNIAETQRIYNLVEDVERTLGMMDVLGYFALIPIYEAMKQANTRFDELWQQRNKELSENEIVDSKLIRANCTKALVALYDGIEYLASESEDPAWLPLIRELSQLSGYYKRQLKARVTRRKNRENVTDEPLIRPEVTSSTDEN
jgi:hypothetical protein